jgi:DNA polymerase-3 subunit gamma/tau
MNIVDTLNLARKWRSKNFDQIIGQDLVVRILKNSLYREHFFPVYLLSGQRGCGKTTTARVFAGAINCQALPQFRQQPQTALLPCLTCQSCIAMAEGKHPDFIEIDAASHTGVDNVRSIIDAAALLPIMGNKRIYLIDEAHMLSKAAFNAFLKILEEPPATALFMLATTDPEKIIETVRSRCFQLFFKPIAGPTLIDHLVTVCEREQIAYDVAGLSLIVQETEGSARDALNTLERVRFSAAKVDRQAVAQLLGHIEDAYFVTLLATILSRDVHKLLAHLHKLDRAVCSATFIWTHFITLLHTAIRSKHGVRVDAFQQLLPDIEHVVRNVTWKDLYHLLELCYKQEIVFLQARDQFAFLEMLFLQLCTGIIGSDTDSDKNSGAASALEAAEPVDSELVQEDEEEDDVVMDDLHNAAAVWQRCVHDVASLHDPVLLSLYKQSFFKSFDAASGSLIIEFDKKMLFFKDKLDETRTKWLPIIQQWFGANAVLLPEFTRVVGQEAPTHTIQPASVVPTQPAVVPAAKAPQQRQAAAPYVPRAQTTQQRKIQSPQEPKFIIPAPEQWQKTTMLLQYFPGTVYELQEHKQHG